MKTILLLVLLLLSAQDAPAQVVAKANFTSPDNLFTTTAAVNATYKLYLNNGTPENLTQVSCSGATAPFTCQGTISANQATLALTPGTRAELSATVGTVEGPRSAPFTPSPSAPSGLIISK